MSQQLIKVDYTKDQPTVSARELYEGLEIKSNFTTWFDRMCEYGFSEKTDFNFSKKGKVQLEGEREVKRELCDYEISIDMAKQICMIQRTDKGKQYRQYFIDLEKAWNTPEQVMARALRIANGEIEKLKADNQVLIADTERMKPKEIFADAVSASKTSILVGMWLSRARVGMVARVPVSFIGVCLIRRVVGIVLSPGGWCIFHPERRNLMKLLKVTRI